ncbi:hypothetical protein [Methanonatronarchaeum sp. AMET-Sl]|uniref:hypothetical protein n=1 Tax=Methanonatronarchaeum sp. AMET-Sl TaxID=3037654 RepID=UPI00244E3B8C|nr:hypothetical protein [Methanonatronarchaeum sp. AMET-Sl]WGI17148.1 hypothetical protein QEN48_06510 [Methanonatronarchaeum sp. AMET-Sl]
MTIEIDNDLNNFLNSDFIVLKTERRAWGTEKGVPDFLVWVKLKHFPIGQLFPILIELETDFNNSIKDYEKFSKRSDAFQNKNNYRPKIPIISKKPIPKEYQTFQIKSKYEINSIKLKRIIKNRKNNERFLYRKIDAFYRKKNRCDLDIESKLISEGILAYKLNLQIDFFNRKVNFLFPILVLDSEKSNPNKNIYQIHNFLKEINLPCITVIKHGRIKNKSIELETRFETARISHESLKKHTDYN